MIKVESLLKKTKFSVYTTRARDLVTDLFLRQTISYQFGLKIASSKHTLPVVCCLVRNGAYWLPAFLRHYRELGVKEFFFLDNNSSDQTLQILQNENDVGVYASKASFKSYNCNLRRVLVQVARPRGWVLGVDIDEFFDFPYSGEVGLTRVCAYLERYRFNAMSTHQLDMFSDGPVNKITQMQNNNIKQQYPFYSLADIRSDNYDAFRERVHGLPAIAITLPGKTWKAYFDGIRFARFGLRVWLTKHALFKNDRRLVPFHHPHIHRNVRVADTSGVLYHYKFTPCFSGQIKDALREKQYFNESAEYVHYGRQMNAGKDLILKDDKSKKLFSVNQLVDEKFLVVSPAYRIMQ